MKAIVRETKREMEDGLGTNFSLNFEGNRKMFLKEVKRVRKITGRRVESKG